MASNDRCFGLETSSSTSPSERRFAHRFAQQGVEAAAGDRAEHIDDGGHDRERRAHAKAEKRHRHQFAVLHNENDDREHEHDDNGEIDPAHGSLLAFLSGWSSLQRRKAGGQANYATAFSETFRRAQAFR
jgi:hypothetical protein